MRLNAYRLSLEWSRLQPTEGSWDAAAAENYRQMLIALRAAGIAPYVTLYHFTVPQWFAAKGGWESTTALVEFQDYVERVAAEFGDVVDHWITINEPNVLAFSAYLDGQWPPGVVDGARATEVYATLVEAHAIAALALRTYDTTDVTGDGNATLIGLAHHVRGIDAASPNPLDQAITASTDSFFNDAVPDALLTGRIQMTIPGEITIDRPVANLQGSIDFLGINYYTRDYYRANLADPTLSSRFSPASSDYTDLGWEIYPEGLQRLLERYAAYGWPLYITENGVADATDALRPDFIKTHLLALQRAIENGTDVRGYFHWSLMDNFEWSEGYTGRFGLYEVDFKDPLRPRTPRPSATLIREIADALAP